MQDDEAAISEIGRRIEEAWNAGDGTGFAAPFADDADYVIVNGARIKGREAIDMGHRQIFNTFYKGSVSHFTIESIRFLRPDVAVVHCHANVRFQDGETMRENLARSTWVATKEDGKWSIAAFHNTPIVMEGQR